MDRCEPSLGLRIPGVSFGLGAGVRIVVEGYEGYSDTI